MNKKDIIKALQLFKNIPNKPLSAKYFKSENKSIAKREKESKMILQRITMSRDKLLERFTI